MRRDRALPRPDSLDEDTSSYVRGDASLGLRGGTEGAGVSFVQDGTARPWGFELFELVVGEHVALDVAPSLADRPDRWRRRYTASGADLDIVFFQVLGSHWGVQLCRCDNYFGSEKQQDGGATAERSLQTADWAPLTITRRRDGAEISRFDLYATEAHATGGDHSGVVVTQWFPRLTGLPLGFAHADFALGESTLGATQVIVDGQVVSSITTTDLPDLHVPTARARLYSTIAGVDASAGVERGIYLSMDAALVVEERATASLATKVGDTRLSASEFGAHSVVWTSATDSSEHVTGGGALTVDVALRDHWRLVNRADVARTFYASLDGAREPRVDTAMRIDIGLHRQIANWIPR